MTDFQLTSLLIRLTFEQKAKLIKKAEESGVEVDKKDALNHWVLSLLGVDA